MTSKTHAIAVMITFLILVTQASAESAVAAARPGFDVAVVDTPNVEVGARSHDHYRQGYDRYVRHRYYHPTLPYEGYRPYALPIYQCSYYGPFPLWPYCYGW